MKTYVKPKMDIQTFVTNEFIAACKPETKLACLNMNHAQVVYYDSNDNKILDESEKKLSNTYNFKEQNDCGTTGSTTGGNHTVAGTVGADLVYVGYGNYNNMTFTPAYLVRDVKKDSPHFVSVSSVVNASN